MPELLLVLLREQVRAHKPMDLLPRERPEPELLELQEQPVQELVIARPPFDGRLQVAHPQRHVRKIGLLWHPSAPSPFGLVVFAGQLGLRCGLFAVNLARPRTQPVDAIPVLVSGHVAESVDVLAAYRCQHSLLETRLALAPIL